MNSPQSIHEIDLSPLPGKEYWSSGRSLEQEIIYFLLVDRFHDSKNRTPHSGSKKGFGTQEQLQKSCGGTINGIRRNLSYIKKLGCTAIWLSPVLENNPSSYHGYAIQNFLKVDPRFGTLEDLQLLVSEAHSLEIKIFLDVVLNHSGDNWYYLGNRNFTYKNGIQYRFGGWRTDYFPLPKELRNQEFYKRKGAISNWDEYPETQEGDFFSLKKLRHDESEKGLALQEILLKIYCYWIKETDCDGFRLDAVKHLGELPAARFSSKIKEYTSALGKKTFHIFGEVAGNDNVLSKYLQPVESKIEKIRYEGLDAVLDFPTHFLLPKIFEGNPSAKKLIERYKNFQAFPWLTQGSYPLITFLDNHDQIEKNYKQRICARLGSKQVAAALTLLMCLPGVPCIYYGTEQGFGGEGESDTNIREAMFDLEHPYENAMNEQSVHYQLVSTICNLRRESRALQFGSLVFPSISEDGLAFDLKDLGVLVFSRIYLSDQITVAINLSTNESKTIYVKICKNRNECKSLNGAKFSIVRADEEVSIIRLDLEPLEFIILK